MAPLHQHTCFRALEIAPSLPQPCFSALLSAPWSKPWRVTSSSQSQRGNNARTALLRKHMFISTLASSFSHQRICVSAFAIALCHRRPRAIVFPTYSWVKAPHQHVSISILVIVRLKENASFPKQSPLPTGKRGITYTRFLSVLPLRHRSIENFCSKVLSRLVLHWHRHVNKLAAAHSR